MYVIHLLAGCRLSRRGRPSLASLLSPFSSRLCLPSISFLSRSTGLPPFARPTDASSLSPSSPLHPRSYQSLAHHAVVCLPTASAPPPPQRHAQHGPRSQGSRWRILRVRVPPPLSLTLSSPPFTAGSNLPVQSSNDLVPLSSSSAQSFTLTLPLPPLTVKIRRRSS